MEIIKEDRRYYIDDNGVVAAEMTYSPAGDTMIIIDHTDVNDNYRGQGLGRKLLDRVVEDARKSNIKIIPLCPYAKSVFDKDESIRDTLKV